MWVFSFPFFVTRLSRGLRKLWGKEYTTSAGFEGGWRGAVTRRPIWRICFSLLSLCGVDNKRGVAGRWEVLLFTVMSAAYLPPNTDFEFAAGSDWAYRPFLFLSSIFHMSFSELG